MVRSCFIGNNSIISSHPKFELVHVHSNLPAPERDPFRFQPQLLIRPSRSRQQNFPTGAQHPMPRQSPVRPSQRPNHLPSRPRKSSRLRHRPISSNLPPRNFPNNAPNLVEHFASLRKIGDCLLCPKAPEQPRKCTHLQRRVDRAGCPRFFAPSNILPRTPALMNLYRAATTGSDLFFDRAR